MKKLFPKTPAELRRRELNRSASDLARPGKPWFSGTSQPIPKRKRVMGRIGNTLSVIAFIAAALTVGASIALQI